MASLSKLYCINSGKICTFSGNHSALYVDMEGDKWKGKSLTDLTSNNKI